MGLVLQPMTFAAYGRPAAGASARMAIGSSPPCGPRSPRSDWERNRCDRHSYSCLTTRRFAPLFVTQFLGASTTTC
jgi:hypothetical protein